MQSKSDQSFAFLSEYWEENTGLLAFQYKKVQCPSSPQRRYLTRVHKIITCEHKIKNITLQDFRGSVEKLFPAQVIVIFFLPMYAVNSPLKFFGC